MPKPGGRKPVGEGHSRGSALGQQLPCPGSKVNARELRKGTSLGVQWLRPCTSSAGGTGLTPGWRTKIPHGAAKKKAMEEQDSR